MITDNDKGITGVLIDEIMQAVKIINGITGSNLDELLTIYIKAICTNILIKTNRRKFPPDLKYVAIDLVRDKFSLTDADNPDLNAIKSMSEAGRSVTFGATDVIKARLELLAEKQITDNEKLINKFKLLYKT